MSNKPTPAFLATDSLNEDAIRADLELTCRCARENGRPLELILKDVSNVRFDPSRLSRWHEIAMDVVTSF